MAERSFMGRLADEIVRQIDVWEGYHEKYGTSLPSFNSDEVTPVLSNDTPRYTPNTRDMIIDLTVKLLQLVAGPSKIAPIAISHIQTMSAMRWLFHFKIFDLVPDVEPVSYDELAESANVPTPELKRMLRILIASCIFSEPDEDVVEHNVFSRAITHDEDLIRGLPFFYDVVLPASTKMVDATIQWPGSEEANKAASNIALGLEMTFAQYLARHDLADGYTSLMRLLGSESEQHTVHSAEIVQGFYWSYLGKDALVVDLGSCGPFYWKLAELFPHLRFHIRGPQHELTVMRGFVETKNPRLLERIDFCSDEEPIPRGANVYLLAGVIEGKPDNEVSNILRKIARVMDENSFLVITDSLLPEPGEEDMAPERELRCRDITMRQLHNSGARTRKELEELASEAHESLVVGETKRLPGSNITTVTIDFV